jgi:Major Facilitator Superfamily
VFGFLGGWLIDRFGRKRIMIASILLYSLSPAATALCTSVGAFIFFRCATFVGVCVEFIAAITWLAELFPNKRQKEIALGATQAFASVGGLFVTAVSRWITAHADSGFALPVSEAFNQHGAWRYLLLTGLFPAIPILLLLPFVPESGVWRERRAAGTLKRPSFGELFSPQLRRVTLVTAALSACAYAAAFGALQVTTRSIVPGLQDLKSAQVGLKPLQDKAIELNKQLDAVMPAFKQAVAETPGLAALATKRAQARIEQRSAGKTGNKERVAAILADFKTNYDPELAKLSANKPEVKKAVVDREKALKFLGDNREEQGGFTTAISERGESVQFGQEFGGLVGRIVLALLLLTAISRGRLLRLFLLPGILAFAVTYTQLYHASGGAFDAGVFFCGFFVVAQFSYFGEYLPRVFPVHLRGTGGSFATNVGGRMIGTFGAVLTTNIIAPMIHRGSPFDRYALAAGITAVSVLAIGVVLSFFLPEPKEDTSIAESAAAPAKVIPAPA